MGGAAVAENLDFTAMRRAMVASQLRPSDISNRAVIHAMSTAAREDFVPAEKKSVCYMDRSIPLGGARALNPPLATGLMLDRAAPVASDSVLIVGSTTGYVATLLAPMAAHVIALSDDAELVMAARKRLARLANVTVERGDLTKGCKKHGPYTLILIDGAVEQLPDAIIAQLADNGRLVTGMIDDSVTRLAVGRKSGGHFGMAQNVDTEIVPLPQFAAPKVYSF